MFAVFLGANGWATSSWADATGNDCGWELQWRVNGQTRVQKRVTGVTEGNFTAAQRV